MKISSWAPPTPRKWGRKYRQAPVRHGAELQERGHQDRSVARDPPVRREGEREAAAGRHAGKSGDHRFRHPEDLPNHVLLFRGQPVEEVRKCALGPILVHGGHISAGTEGGPRAGKEHGPHVARHRRRLEGGPQLDHRSHIERVQAVGAVDRDRENSSGSFSEHRGHGILRTVQCADGLIGRTAARRVRWGRRNRGAGVSETLALRTVCGWATARGPPIVGRWSGGRSGRRRVRFSRGECGAG